MAEALPGRRHHTMRATCTRGRRATLAPMHSSMLERLTAERLITEGFAVAAMAEVMGDGDKESEIC